MRLLAAKVALVLARLERLQRGVNEAAHDISVALAEKEACLAKVVELESGVPPELSAFLRGSASSAPADSVRHGQNRP